MLSTNSVSRALCATTTAAIITLTTGCILFARPPRDLD